jgi:uncharacterized membrane protein (DUF4010 family)
VTAAIAMGHLGMKAGPNDTGITTEIAILLMYAIGAYVVFGHPQVAVVLGGGVAVLLHAKPMTHRLVQRLGETDMKAMMQFVLITLVVLPVLPDRTYGPFGVLNPREIWWMVVLVVGVSLGGYVALKVYGEHAGTVLGGIIGGLISSTATTVSYARRASQAEGHVAAATLVVMLASSIVYARVLVEIGIAASHAFLELAPPIAAVMVVSILLCGLVWWSHRKTRSELPTPRNPTELKSALVFAALYALVVLAVAAGREFFGDRGIYAVAALSGLTDMDAITLTTSRMAAGNGMSPGTAWRAILIAAIANLVCKAGIVAVLGGSVLFKRTAGLFALHIAAGVAVLLMWPG